MLGVELEPALVDMARTNLAARQVPRVRVEQADPDRLGRPALWAAPLHWARLQAAVLTDDVEAALAGYDARRRAAMAPIQRMARASMEWFETVPESLEGADDALAFSWSLLDRRHDQGRLNERLHRATQVEPVRQVRRRLTAARRVRRALARGEITPREALQR